MLIAGVAGVNGEEGEGKKNIQVNIEQADCSLNCSPSFFRPIPHYKGVRSQIYLLRLLY